MSSTELKQVVIVPNAAFTAASGNTTAPAATSSGAGAAAAAAATAGGGSTIAALRENEPRASMVARLKTDPEATKTGLKASEVERIRRQYGTNEIITKKPSLIMRLLKKFWGLTPWILEATAAASLALQRWAQAGVVIALLVLNALIGFVQETRAESALNSLQEQLKVMARVLRDGEWTMLPARELVPGDIVRLRHGDVVPADVIILEGDLMADQSALTGESDAVLVKTGEESYSGSIVKNGEALVVVNHIGQATKFGKTIQLVSTSAPKLHVEVIIGRVVWALLIMAVVLIGITVIVQLATDLHGFVGNIVLFLALLLSAVPVALPAMFTITMALGSMELSKQGVLISRLSATEDAASMNVLCTDKTGTLTCNRLTVNRIYTVGGGKATETEVLSYAAMCSKQEDMDALDLAVLSEVKQRAIAMPKFKILNFVPFNAARRKTEAKVQFLESGQTMLVQKGAVNRLLDFCHVTGSNRTEVERLVEECATQGFRTIGVVAGRWKDAAAATTTAAKKDDGEEAKDKTKSDDQLGKEKKEKKEKKSKKEKKEAAKDGEDIKMVRQAPTGAGVLELVPAAPAAAPAPAAGLDRRHSIEDKSLARLEADQAFFQFEFVGLLSMNDPARGDSKAVLDELHGLGVRVVMLTGDALAIARTVAKSVGLGDRLQSLVEWRNQCKDNPKLEVPDITQSSGYAEIFPEDKHAIVMQYQKRGHIVGMTGDGVNDAPALRQAEVGVAVSNATDVAKGAASAILLQEGLSGVPHLVRVGRTVHARLVTWIINKIIKNFQTTAFVAVAYMVRQEWIVNAYNLLVLVFLVDFVTLALAGDNARWSPKPNNWQVIRLSIVSGVLGVLNVLESFGILYIGLYVLGYRHDSDKLNTFCFQVLFFFGMFTTFMVRERRFFFQSRPSWVLVGIIACDTLAVLLACYFGINALGLHKITWWHTGIIIGWTAGFTFLFNDPLKVILFHFFLKSE